MDASSDSQTDWYLQGHFGTDDRIERRQVHPFPFLIGRSSSCHLQIETAGISGRHAEIILDDARIQIRDLESTNGTFLNGERLGSDPVVIGDGDVIHFGSEEVRIRRFETVSVSPQTERLGVITEALSFDWTTRSARLDRILEGELESWFQPIVEWDGTIIAWEALGRGRVDGEIVLPDEMFHTARETDRELDLCRALRRVALESACALPEPKKLFFNAAAPDISDWDLLLDEIRSREGEYSVVVEIHEAAVTDTDSMKRIHTSLAELGCELAFDDFGAGQSRLRELTELRPDYLKFDTSFIQGIDEAPPIRRELVEFFVGLVHEYGVSSVAEGVETEREAAFCRNAGFGLAQGYLFARPTPIADL